MRIIAGKYKGRIVRAPHGHKTHPMGEKQRGALFNVIGDISGLTLLDAYAGSGAVGFEALSRGAKKVVAVDNDKLAARCIDENTKALNLGREYSFCQANIVSWLNNNEVFFDIVVADPPYDNVNIEHLSQIGQAVKAGGIYVLSLPDAWSELVLDGFKLLTKKQYAGLNLVFFRKTD